MQCCGEGVALLPQQMIVQVVSQSLQPRCRYCVKITPRLHQLDVNRVNHLNDGVGGVRFVIRGTAEHAGV